MKHCAKILVVVCALLMSGTAGAEPDVLSAVPSDACGFAAVKSPQGIIDQFKALLPEIEELEESLEDPLGPIRELLGDVDLTGPAAVVLLNLENLDEDEPPVAFLISAADAEAVVASHKEMAAEGETGLPEGVVKLCSKEKIGKDLYLAAKDDFVIVTLKAELAEELLKSQTSLAVLPEVRQAYDQGKIVAQADIEKVQPFLMKCFDEAQTEMAATWDDELTIVNDVALLYFDIIQGLLEQCENLIYIIDLNDRGLFCTEKTILKDGSAAAEFMKAHIGQGDPSYEGLPAGSFIVAGAAKISPEQVEPIIDAVLVKVGKYPRLQEKLNEENGQKILAGVRAFYRQFSGMAFTGGMGSPATGMLSFVGRLDVADSAAFKEQIKEVCRSELVSKLTEYTGIELVYSEAIEIYEGVDIDAIRIKLAELDEAEGESDAAQTGQQVMRFMPMVIGPDLSIRVLAPNDKQVLIVIGGGYARAERVINVINGHGSSLADYAKINKAVRSMPANRMKEIHFDFGQLLGLIKSLAPQESAELFGGSEGFNTAGVPLISASYAAEHNAYREDMIVPADFIRTLTAVFVSVMQRSQRPRGEEANASICATNLKGLDTCLYLYANSHKGKYPDPARWREVLIEEDLAPRAQFICPSVGGDPEKDNDYVFVPWPDIAVDADLLVLFEAKANHFGYRNVCTGNHGVMRVDEAQFQQMMAKTIEALKAEDIEFKWD